MPRDRDRTTGLPTFLWSGTATFVLALPVPFLPPPVAVSLLGAAIAVATVAGVRAVVRTHRVTAGMSLTSAHRFWTGRAPAHLYPSGERRRIRVANRAMLIAFSATFTFYVYLILATPTGLS